jgi:ABC-type phosphate transport system substrate-binding protein
MKPVLRASLAAAMVAVLILSGCGSSKHANVTPPANTGGSVTTTPGSAGSTTVCTIPQNNGGDHDSDNNGGPSDGDGCDV